MGAQLLWCWGEGWDWRPSASHQQQGGGELEEVEEGHDEKGLVQQIVEEEGRLLWQGLAQDREQGARQHVEPK